MRDTVSVFFFFFFAKQSVKRWKGLFFVVYCLLKRCLGNLVLEIVFLCVREVLTRSLVVNVSHLGSFDMIADAIVSVNRVPFETRWFAAS